MRLFKLGFSAACAGVLLGLAASTAPASASADLNAAVLAEINLARAHPADYARTLGREQGDWRGDWGQGYARNRGSARDEAVDFLSRQQPLPPLKASRGLAEAAAVLSGRQARSGDEGHDEGLMQRIQAHGVWSGLVAETISYGQATPANVVAQLIIDDGVPGRGHRRTLFDPTLSHAGVSCGAHPNYGAMCVIDFAGAMVAR
jgi:hypothetical protein